MRPETTTARKGQTMSISERLDPETGDADWDDLAAALRAVLDLCDKALAVKVSGSSEGDAAMAAFAAAAHTAIAATLGEES